MRRSHGRPGAHPSPLNRPSLPGLPRCRACCSGGDQATAQLAACPAVRELLVKPLAIRHASLKRFIFAGGASGTAGAAQAPRTSPFDVPSEQTLVSDLSGDMLEAAAEALEAAGQTQQAVQLRDLPQPSPSSVAKGVLTDTLETFMF